MQLFNCLLTINSFKLNKCVSGWLDNQLNPIHTLKDKACRTVHTHTHTPHTQTYTDTHTDRRGLFEFVFQSSFQIEQLNDQE